LGLLDKDTVDSGNGTDTTTLRPGLALGILPNGQLTHWNPLSEMITASEGSRDFVGFFVENLDLGYYGSTSERLIYCLVGGNVKASSIIIPGGDAGIADAAYEILLREAAGGNFLFDDDLNRIIAPKTRYNMNAVATTGEIATAEVTLEVKDHNTDVFLYDATATTALVVPNPIPGLRYRIHPFDFDITLTATTAGDLLFDRDGSPLATDALVHAGNLTFEILGVPVSDSSFKYICTTGVPAAS